MHVTFRGFCFFKKRWIRLSGPVVKQSNMQKGVMVKNHAAETLVSISRQRKPPKSILMNFHLCQNPSLSRSPNPLAPHLQLSDSGFLAFSWSNPSEQYWTSHSIQTSFHRIFVFPFVVIFCSFLPSLVQSFPFCCACIPCTLFLLMKYRELGLVY